MAEKKKNVNINPSLYRKLLRDSIRLQKVKGYMKNLSDAIGKSDHIPAQKIGEYVRKINNQLNKIESPYKRRDGQEIVVGGIGACSCEKCQDTILCDHSPEQEHHQALCGKCGTK